MKERKEENSGYACMFCGKKDIYTCVLVCA